MTWVKVDIVEILDSDMIVLSITDQLVRTYDHPLLRRSIDVDELIQTVQNSCAQDTESWTGVWRQFQIDFPRYQMYLNHSRCLDVDETMRQLRTHTDETTVRNIVTLATQGMLADVYFGLVRLLVKDNTTHVVDGGGAWHIYIDIQNEQVSLRVSKELGLTRIDNEDQAIAIAQIQVVMKLQLLPVMHGSETLEITPVV